MTNEPLLSKWRDLLSDFSSSGLGVCAWCAANNIPQHRYYYWRRKLSGCMPPRAAHGDIDWLAVPVGPGSPADAGLQVRVGAAAIDVASGFDPALLRAIVAALEAGL